MNRVLFLRWLLVLGALALGTAGCAVSAAGAARSTRDVTTRRGLAGKQLRFGHDESREPHLYYVTVLLGEETAWLFFPEKKIYVLEAGGTKQLMEQHAGQIDWSVREFNPSAL